MNRKTFLIRQEIAYRMRSFELTFTIVVLTFIALVAVVQFESANVASGQPISNDTTSSNVTGAGGFIVNIRGITSMKLIGIF